MRTNAVPLLQVREMRTKHAAEVLCYSCGEQICKRNGPTIMLTRKLIDRHDGRRKNFRLPFCNACGQELESGVIVETDEQYGIGSLDMTGMHIESQ